MTGFPSEVATPSKTGFPSDVFEAKIREIAAERPGFVYPNANGNCVYVELDHRGQLVGSCLIGCALVAIGIPAEELVVNGNDTIRVFANRNHWDIDSVTLDWADVVQDKQDAGNPWGSAVERADMLMAGVADYD